MYDADAIEAINFEQLATITDRLLLRHGRRPSRLPPAREPVPVVEDRFAVPSLARGSRVRVVDERTLLVRPRPARARWLAVTIVIPALLGTVAGLLVLL